MYYKPNLSDRCNILFHFVVSLATNMSSTRHGRMTPVVGGAEPPQGHMVKCVRVLPCYMAPPTPQGHSPNDLVICMCDLPCWMVFTGPLGVVGFLWGSRGVRWRPGKGWGDPREVPGGPGGGLGNLDILCVRNEFADGIMKYGCFQFGVVL